MIIAVDFDNTTVRDDQPYSDVTSPLRLMPGAREALQELKAAGHKLILWSGRANLAIRENPILDPLVRAGKRVISKRHWDRGAGVNQKRFEQMVAFADRELAGIFDAIDDGLCGKVEADLYIDDRAITFGHRLGGLDWPEIAALYGEPVRVEQPTVLKQRRTA